MNLDDPCDAGGAHMDTEDYFAQNPETDPFMMGHHMVWALVKSNYWGREIINPAEFYDHYELIAKQYEKFYAEREPKHRPEKLWPTLKKLLAYRIKKQKEEAAKVAAPVDAGEEIKVDGL